MCERCEQQKRQPEYAEETQAKQLSAVAFVAGALAWMTDHNIIEGGVLRPENLPDSFPPREKFVKLEEMGFRPNNQEIEISLMTLALLGALKIMNIQEYYILLFSLEKWDDIKAAAIEKGWAK